MRLHFRSLFFGSGRFFFFHNVKLLFAYLPFFPLACQKRIFIQRNPYSLHILHCQTIALNFFCIKRIANIAASPCNFHAPNRDPMYNCFFFGKYINRSLHIFYISIADMHFHPAYAAPDFNLCKSGAIRFFIIFIFINIGNKTLQSCHMSPDFCFYYRLCMQVQRYDRKTRLKNFFQIVLDNLSILVYIKFENSNRYYF